MLTFELLDAHRDALKMKGTIVKLLRRVEELNAAGEAVSAKVTLLQVDLDLKVVVQQGREKKLERLRGESRERETRRLNCQKLGGAREDELRVARGEHGVASQGL